MEAHAPDPPIDEPVLAGGDGAVLVSIEPPRASRLHREPWFRSAIRQADAAIRRADGIVEFCDDPDCILRIALRRAGAPIGLDGVVIPAAAKVIDLHLYNDHLLRSDGHGLQWGARFRRRLVGSFGQLAQALEAKPELKDVQALRARLASPLGRRRSELVRFAARFGFEPAHAPPAERTAERLHDLGENIWLLLMSFAFGTQAHEHRTVLRWRGDVWITRERLIDRFGRKASPRVT